MCWQVPSLTAAFIQMVLGLDVSAEMISEPTHFSLALSDFYERVDFAAASAKEEERALLIVAPACDARHQPLPAMWLAGTRHPQAC